MAQCGNEGVILCGMHFRNVTVNDDDNDEYRYLNNYTIGYTDIPAWPVFFQIFQFQLRLRTENRKSQGSLTGNS